MITNRRSFILITLLLVSSFTSWAVEKMHVEGEPYVLISVFKIEETKVDEAIDLLSDLQLNTLESEDGCLIYDVLLSDNDPTQVFVYESYDSEGEYSKHIKSKHYIDIFEKKLKPLLKEATTTKVFLLNFEGGY